MVTDGIVSGYIPDSNLVTLASQDGAGSGMKSSIVGSGISVDPSENPNFVVDAQDMDMTGLESLQFDANSLVLGQHVQVQSMRAIQRDSKGNVARVAPETIKLEPQTLTGTVANYQAGTTPGSFSFDLVFATNASANVLNPFFYTMHVYQQRGTDMQSLTAGISNGAKVRVWGLVFYSQLPAEQQQRQGSAGLAWQFSGPPTERAGLHYGCRPNQRELVSRACPCVLPRVRPTAQSSEPILLRPVKLPPRPGHGRRSSLRCNRKLQ